MLAAYVQVRPADFRRMLGDYDQHAQEVVRAGAQLALPTIQQALTAADFFATHGEFDVAVDTFHPQMTEAGQLQWDPAGTPTSSSSARH